MGRQRKSAGSFFCFSIFRSKKQRYYDEEGYEDGIKAQKVWHNDEDRGRWGVEPEIDMKGQAFIARYRKKVTESI
ncbi:hypothetical protein QN277_014025 [Acacia crassicarpa]|uniref:Uncharacterized protein n=1 Tax=Acacia crassicarpa TaxID=499986 RepID=A0AAE1TF36_9FABA|nr:hypothetical protein QN277_014025 [Acacia crassicarpa]